jgi:hypothetical protein
VEETLKLACLLLSIFFTVRASMLKLKPLLFHRIGALQRIDAECYPRSAYPWSTIQMVITTAAINNPAPSHTIASPGAEGDLDLARATGGILLRRIDFTCTPKNLKGRPFAGPAPELHSCIRNTD